MLINTFLKYTQSIFQPLYNASIALKGLDLYIFISIIMVILSSGFAQSDYIGYFALITVILTAIKLLIAPNNRCSMSTGDKFLLLYFIIVIISVSGSSLFMLSLKGFLKTFTYIAFYVSFIHYLKDNRKNLKYILLAIGLVVFCESIIALKQNFMSVSAISGWQDVSHLNPEDVMTRVYGTLKPYNPNLFGGYMLAALPSTLVAVYLPLINKHYKTAFAGMCIFLLASFAIILTGCRGAYVGLFVEFVLLAVCTYRFLSPYYKKLFTLLNTVISTVMICIICSVGSLRARIFSIFAMREDSSNSFRFNVYNSSLEMFKDNWLLGIGVGNQNFREIYGLYMRTGFDALSSYNIYLETAVESGIFALITFVGFIWINLARAVHYILKRRNVNVLYLTISAVSLIGMLIHGFVDTVFFRPQIQFVFWIMIGIIRVVTFPKR